MRPAQSKVSKGCWARSLGVDPAGDGLFAGARLAGDQHGRSVAASRAARSISSRMTGLEHTNSGTLAAGASEDSVYRSADLLER